MIDNSSVIARYKVLHAEQAGALANFTEAEELDPGFERVADSAPKK